MGQYRSSESVSFEITFFYSSQKTAFCPSPQYRSFNIIIPLFQKYLQGCYKSKMASTKAKG